MALSFSYGKMGFILLNNQIVFYVRRMIIQVIVFTFEQYIKDLFSNIRDFDKGKFLNLINKNLYKLLEKVNLWWNGKSKS